MTRLSGEIVGYLRGMGIEPEATSSSSADNNQLPKYALIYDSNNQFHTAYTALEQWWMVDFKRPVSIKSYLIQTGDWCHFVYSWKSYVSLDKRNWTIVDQQAGYPLGKTFALSNVYKARYFKV